VALVFKLLQCMHNLFVIVVENQEAIVEVFDATEQERNVATLPLEALEAFECAVQANQAVQIDWSNPSTRVSSILWFAVSHTCPSYAQRYYHSGTTAIPMEPTI
jgi:hypothetical protein